MSSVVSRVLRSKPAAFRLPPSHQLYHTAVRRPEVLCSNGQVLFKQIALPLHRHKCSSSQRPATHIAGRHSRWWKVAAATLVSSGAAAAAAIAVCSEYLETVPYINRKHLIVRSIQYDRRLGDFAFHYAREMYGASNILDRLHPESVRVYLITSKLVRAIHQGLTIKSLKQGDDPEAARQQTAHLDGLDWDAIVVRDKFGARSTASGKIFLHTGCFDLFKTDEEIASVIAHEVSQSVRLMSSFVLNFGRVQANSTSEPFFSFVYMYRLGTLLRGIQWSGTFTGGAGFRPALGSTCYKGTYVEFNTSHSMVISHHVMPSQIYHLL